MGEGAVRAFYVCGECGARGVKLWRFGSSSCVELRCRGCTERLSGEQLSAPGWCIGNYVPAVYDEEASEDEWYGYTSIPQDRVEWWLTLPDFEDLRTRVAELERELSWRSEQLAKVGPKYDRARARVAKLECALAKCLVAIEGRDGGAAATAIRRALDAATAAPEPSDG